MRFSAVVALCAAPLALAGTLQADLIARGAGHEDGANGGGNLVVESTSITEVIIIWVNNGGGAPTSTVQAQSTIAGAAAPPGSQATHTVVVGGSAGLVYSPDTIEAAIGDMVIFTFLEQNHTATQSAFTTPCEALAGGFDSGFMPNINSSVTPPPQMAMQVTVATPIWFYCRQKGHCGKGMTFSINPTQNKTQAMFQQMAIAQNGTGSTAVIAGGSSTGSTSTVAVAGSAATQSVNTGNTGSGTLAAGTGTLDGTGSCQCSCLCGEASFPNAAVQGVNGFGGLSGAMPLNALMST
jgi:plastocyanin